MPESAYLSLVSPDRRVELRVTGTEAAVPSALAWQVWLAGQLVLAPSPLAVPPGWEVSGVVRRRARRSVAAAGDPPGAVEPLARELVVRLHAPDESARRMELLFRCSDHGAAVRLRIPRQRDAVTIPAAGATARFCFPAGAEGWVVAGGDGAPGVPPSFRPLSLTTLAKGCETPLLLQYPHGRMACLVTAGGPPLTLARAADGLAVAADPIEPRRPYESPWQVLLLADAPCDLLTYGGWLQEPLPRAEPAVYDASTNCLLPFVRDPRWSARALAPPAVPPDVTPAHRRAVMVVAGGGGVAWDETRFLRGALGAFFLVARRAGAVWQVAGLTGEEGRVWTVRLEELLAPRGEAAAPVTYTLEILRDPLPGETSEDGLVRELFPGVDVWDKPRLELLPRGGFLLRLEAESAGGAAARGAQAECRL
jgi:hypothetical protein